MSSTEAATLHDDIGVAKELLEGGRIDEAIVYKESLESQIFDYYVDHILPVKMSKFSQQQWDKFYEEQWQAKIASDISYLANT